MSEAVEASSEQEVVADEVKKCVSCEKELTDDECQTNKNLCSECCKKGSGEVCEFC